MRVRGMGMGAIRHTVLSENVPKLGLEFKWVKGNVLVYHPTTRDLSVSVSARKPMLSYDSLVI